MKIVLIFLIPLLHVLIAPALGAAIYLLGYSLAHLFSGAQSYIPTYAVGMGDFILFILKISYLLGGASALLTAIYIGIQMADGQPLNVRLFFGLALLPILIVGVLMLFDGPATGFLDLTQALRNVLLIVFLVTVTASAMLFLCYQKITRICPACLVAHSGNS
jgi:hypothetical protein